MAGKELADIWTKNTRRRHKTHARFSYEFLLLLKTQRVAGPPLSIIFQIWFINAFRRAINNRRPPGLALRWTKPDARYYRPYLLFEFRLILWKYKTNMKYLKLFIGFRVRVRRSFYSYMLEIYLCSDRRSMSYLSVRVLFTI